MADSLPGLQASIAEALSSGGRRLRVQDLRPFIGPGIRTILKNLENDLTEGELDGMERCFRASYYDTDGVRNALLYEGVKQTLEALKASGVELFPGHEQAEVGHGQPAGAAWHSRTVHRDTEPELPPACVSVEGGDAARTDSAIWGECGAGGDGGRYGEGGPPRSQGSRNAVRVCGVWVWRDRGRRGVHSPSGNFPESWTGMWTYRRQRSCDGLKMRGNG